MDVLLVNMNDRTDGSAGVLTELVGRSVELFMAGEFDRLSALTLWLCQNSYWKWPFIVSFPMKNGDFP